MQNTNKRWFYIILGAVLIAIGLLLMQYVGWLKILNIELGILIIIIGISFWIYAYCWMPTSDSKVYFDSNGLPDTNTERYYEAKKLRFGQGFITRGLKLAFPDSSLKSFWVINGRISVTTKSEDTFECNLSNLKVKVQYEKKKFTGKKEIAGYTLKDTENNETIKFYYPGVSFEPDEWRDIAGVLSQSDTVKESKLSKIFNFFSNAKEDIEDFDFSNLSSSVVSTSTNMIISGASKRLIDFALGKKKNEGKVSRIIKKIIGWSLVIFSVLYIFCDVWMQIEQHKIEKELQNSEYQTTDWKRRNYTNKGDYISENEMNYYDKDNRTSESSRVYKFGGPIPISGDISVFSSLSTHYLTYEDIKNYDAYELRILRNAIYALHNYSFHSEDLQDFFKYFDNYTPLTQNPTLNEIERTNVYFIQQYE